MPNLLTPTTVGAFSLQHRVVLAPLTRMRSEVPGNVPGPLMVEHYGQRATGGGLLITEATFVSRQGNGGYGSPGIENDDQREGWRAVVDAVHAKGGTILMQLWHAGRASHADLQPNGGKPVAPSAIQGGVGALLEGGFALGTPPRALETGEIVGVVSSYRDAARRAKEAGFDGIEIHAANGYLIDQFLQDGSNRRTDSYGGTAGNRSRLLMEVLGAVTEVWDAPQIGVRIGPSNTFNGMGDSDALGLFSYVADGLRQLSVAYLHIIEPRIAGNTEVGDQTPVASAMLKPLFRGPIIAAGGFDPTSGNSILASGAADLVAFGRLYISNPDLPHRIRDHQPLAPYDRSTFYYSGETGYNDYPVAALGLAAA